MVIVTIAALLLPAEAAAARIILHVEGANAATLSTEIRDALPAGTTVVAGKGFDAALARDRRESIGHALASGKAIARAAERVERAFSQSDADIAIVVVGSRARHGRRAVRVLAVAAGQSSRHFFRSANQDSSAGRSDRVKWWSELLGEAFAQASSPAEPAPSPGATPAPPSSNAATRGGTAANDASAAPTSAVLRTSETGASVPNAAARSNGANEGSAASVDLAPSEPRDSVSTDRTSSLGALRREDWRLMASIESSLRRFEDSQPNERRERVYKASPVPGFSIAGELYPLLDGRLGLGAAFARSVGLQSLTRDGAVVGTSWTRIEGAARWRFPTASHENAPWVGLFAGYAYCGFAFDSEPAQREIPRAEYHIARLGLDARVPIDRVVVIAGAEGDWLFDIAPLGNVLARGGAGMTGRLAFGYRFARRLIVRVDGRYARMWFGLQREGNPSVLDQYATAGIGVEATY